MDARSTTVSRAGRGRSTRFSPAARRPSAAWSSQSWAPVTMDTPPRPARLRRAGRAISGGSAQPPWLRRQGGHARAQVQEQTRDLHSAGGDGGYQETASGSAVMRVSTSVRATSVHRRAAIPRRSPAGPGRRTSLTVTTWFLPVTIDGSARVLNPGKDRLNYLRCSHGRRWLRSACADRGEHPASDLR